MLNVFQMKQQQQHEVQCLQTAAAMTELWQLQLFSPVRPRPRLTHHPQELSSFLQHLQDEAKDDAKKEKNLNDFPDLTERSGRAVKVSSRVKFK